MEELTKLLNSNLFEKTIKIAITIVISIIAYYIIKSVVEKSLNNEKFKNFKNKKTSKSYINVVVGIIRYAIILIDIIIMFKILDIDISSVIAGVGVAGAAFIFAIQDFLKDIIRGSSILSGDYFKVGDIVKYKDIEGKVILLSLKNTKIQVLKTQNILSIANRNIDEIEVLSNNIYIDIPLPYELKVKDAEKVINKIITRIKKLENIDDSKYMGTNELGESSILYLIQVKCNPKNKLQVRRDSIREILLTLEENNISVPYNQIDVHQK